MRLGQAYHHNDIRLRRGAHPMRLLLFLSLRLVLSFPAYAQQELLASDAPMDPGHIGVLRYAALSF